MIKYISFVSCILFSLLFHFLLVSSFTLIIKTTFEPKYCLRIKSFEFFFLFQSEKKITNMNWINIDTIDVLFVMFKSLHTIRRSFIFNLNTSKEQINSFKSEQNSFKFYRTTNRWRNDTHIVTLPSDPTYTRCRKRRRRSRKKPPVFTDNHIKRL